MQSMTSSANIGSPQTLPIDSLKSYVTNPRMGDVAAIKQSMLTNGVFRPIVVNKGTHTGRANEVLAGNHSLKAMRELAQEKPEDTRWHNIDVWLVDVDEEHATRIVLADNRTADLGGYDNDVLLELLDNLDGDYLGTGYDEAYVGALLGEYTPDEWDGNTENPYDYDGGNNNEEYEEINDANLSTDYRCPKCSYEWSGAAK